MMAAAHLAHEVPHWGSICHPLRATFPIRKAQQGENVRRIRPVRFLAVTPPGLGAASQVNVELKHVPGTDERLRAGHGTKR
ncbi:hypothetical protein ACCO45_002540 [Purpureocillium lilacinum]|uniref:Uncharacterized protein n=1 Tax=Purpureocillium lilacinum TaxID=33203 RepID=A0ACC4EA62_PURLI